jgi:hypothetical protein
MSFFDKIKKLFEEDKKPEKETRTESISFEQLPKKIEALIKESSAKNQGLRKQIDERISAFALDIGGLINNLKQVDLSKRKEYDKIKVAVKQNLELYIFYLDKLSKDLKKLEDGDLGKHIDKIFLILNDFNKASYAPFEKATFLIGKEMAAARNAVMAFAQDMNRIVEDNKTFFEEAKLINQVNNLVKEAVQAEALSKDAEFKIANFGEKIKSLREEHENTKKEIDNVKNSEDYKKDSEEKEDYIRKQNLLEKELQLIRQKTELKSLAKVFHHDKKKSHLIKEYSNDFKKALKSDETLEIVRMVEEVQKIDISSLKGIQEKLAESSMPVTKTDKAILGLEDKLKSIESEVINKEAAINEEKRKQERLAKKKEKTIGELRGLVKPLNIVLQ